MFVKEKLQKPWYNPSISEWFKSILNSNVFILSPGVPSFILLLISLTKKTICVDYYIPDFIELYENAGQLRFRNHTGATESLGGLTNTYVTFHIYITDNDTVQYGYNGIYGTGKVKW